MNSKKNNSGLVFFVRVILPAILAFSLFAGLIFGYLIPGFEKGIMERKREMIRELTHTVWSTCDHYNQKVKSGQLTLDQAQHLSIQSIRAIRYGEEFKDYFWITDLYPRMVMHPYRPQLDGTDLTAMRDPHGKAMFVEFVKAAKNGNGGYVDYMWQWKDDTTRIVPKLSFVKLFKPWGWVIGTGIYIEDVRAEIRRMESQALIISGFICLFISILLVFITRQSYRFERGRQLAETEVTASRERYRALAEAASEGVLIWSEQGLHANKTMLGWLDYPEEEVRQKHLAELVNFSAITFDLLPENLYEELSARQFTECDLKGNHNQVIRVHADLSAILIGDQKAVMMVARPARTSESNRITDTLLFDALHFGYFKTTFSKRNRFLYASRTTRGILGLLKEDEIFQYSIESFFADPDERKSFLKELYFQKKILGRKIKLIRNKTEEFYGFVSVIVKEGASGESWCEGCIEPLGISTSGTCMIPREKMGYSFLLLMDTPVNMFSKPVIECKMNEPVSDVLNLFKESGMSHAVVKTAEGIPVGILWIEEIAYRIASGESPQTPVFQWMYAPPDTVPDSLRLAETLPLLPKSKTKCLLLLNKENNSVTGLLTYDDIVQSFELFPDLLVDRIRNSYSVNALTSIFQSKQQLISSLIRGQADASTLVRLMSQLADEICKRVIELAIRECGNPPVPFAFIQLGSAGRLEQNFLTDQDNALIFENVTAEHLPQTRLYFEKLGALINEWLDQIGYTTCSGKMMAGNPRWCQPLDTWKKYFYQWMKEPGPDELLEISVFYDFNFIYGDQKLSEELKRYVHEDLKPTDIFKHLMAVAWLPFNPEKHYHPDSITNLKMLLMPLVGLVRLYSISSNIKSTETMERTTGLFQAGIFDRNMYVALTNAWNNLMLIRLQFQAGLIVKGTPPDNQLDLKLLDEHRRFQIEKAVEGIQMLIRKTEYDFRTRSI